MAGKYLSELNIAKDVLKEYVAEANDAVELKLVRTAKDLEDDETSFNPEYTHQVFGDTESIFGYKNLKIKLYYSAAKLTTYFGVKFTEKVSPKKFDGIEADNFEKEVKEIIQPGFFTNIDDFVSALPKDEGFQPFGELIHSFKQVTEDNTEQCYEVYQADVTSPGLKEYHERIQTFTLWFIDGASFIDDDDDRWRYYFIYEKYKVNGNTMYSVMGYATVYRYYAYPNRIRPRISQLLILPPFQGLGLGTELMQAIYNTYNKDPEVVDLTVEDPSDSFQRIRDFIDARNCMKLPSFSKEKLLEGFHSDMSHEARENHKINRKQSRRIYEILRFKATNLNDDAMYKSYRLDIKKRLAQPYFKRNQDVMKMKRSLKPDELKASLYNKEQRIEQLESEYQELEAMYKRVVERLAEERL